MGNHKQSQSEKVGKWPVNKLMFTCERVPRKNNKEDGKEYNRLYK